MARGVARGSRSVDLLTPSSRRYMGLPAMLSGHVARPAALWATVQPTGAKVVLPRSRALRPPNLGRARESLLVTYRDQYDANSARHLTISERPSTGQSRDPRDQLL